MISAHILLSLDRLPRRLLLSQSKRTVKSSHGRRIVAAHLTPAVAKFAVTRAALDERALYRAHFADAGMVAPR
jgi:hypothetical protein